MRRRRATLSEGGWRVRSSPGTTRSLLLSKGIGRLSRLISEEPGTLPVRGRSILNQKGDTQEDANKAIQIRAPEKVVEDPPPEPAYPRYRVEPGKRASLGTI